LARADRTNAHASERQPLGNGDNSLIGASSADFGPPPRGEVATPELMNGHLPNSTPGPRGGTPTSWRRLSTTPNLREPSQPNNVNQRAVRANEACPFCRKNLRQPSRVGRADVSLPRRSLARRDCRFPVWGTRLWPDSLTRCRFQRVGGSSGRSFARKSTTLLGVACPRKRKHLWA